MITPSRRVSVTKSLGQYVLFLIFFNLMIYADIRPCPPIFSSPGEFITCPSDAPVEFTPPTSLANLPFFYPKLHGQVDNGQAPTDPRVVSPPLISLGENYYLQIHFSVRLALRVWLGKVLGGKAFSPFLGC